MKKLLSLKIAGFSLIEALIAALVVGVGVLGLAKLQGESFFASSESRMRSQASNLAQDKIEELRNFANENTYTNFTGGVNENTEAIMAGSSTNFTRTWTVDDCPNAVNCKHISVTVTWTDSKNGQQQVQLSSYIAGADLVKSGMVLTTPTTSTAPGTTTTAAPTTTTTPEPSTTVVEPTTTTTGLTTSTTAATTTTTVRIGGGCTAIITGLIVKGAKGKDVNNASVRITTNPLGVCLIAAVSDNLGTYTCTVSIPSGITLTIGGDKIDASVSLGPLLCLGASLPLTGPRLTTTN